MAPSKCRCLRRCRRRLSRRRSRRRWLSLPVHTPEGAWPLRPLAPAAGSRWPVTTGAMPGRDVPCYFRRCRQYPRFCDFVSDSPRGTVACPLRPPHSVSYPGRCLASQAAAVKPLGAGALGSKLRPFALASARASAPASAPASAAASAPVSAPTPASAPAAAPAAEPRGGLCCRSAVQNAQQL